MTRSANLLQVLLILSLHGGTSAYGADTPANAPTATKQPESNIRKYSPDKDGLLAPWINANTGAGRVLVLPPGKFDLTEPVFFNDGALIGEYPDAPTQINLTQHGLIWVGQKAWTADRAAYVVDGTLRTKPEKAAPATFDATETPFNRPLHRQRRVKITLELDTPGGKVQPGGLFSFGPFWCWWHPDENKGPEILLTTASSPHDPVHTETWLKWPMPPGAERLKLEWTIDLVAGKATLSVNGADQGTQPIGDKRYFPAILNRRAVIGSAQQEKNELRYRWGQPGGVEERRIRRLELSGQVESMKDKKVATDFKLLARLEINSGNFGAWAPDGSGPMFPVPLDESLYGFQGGNSRLANLDIRPQRFCAALRVGAYMGLNRIENVRASSCAVGIRKLGGAVSYTHYIDRFQVTYVEGAIIGSGGMTIQARDWSISYPSLYGVYLLDANFRLDRWSVISAAGMNEAHDVQYAFYFAAYNAGGTVKITGGMWNDEYGTGALGAWLYFSSGSKDTGRGKLIVEDCQINAPRHPTPTYWLESPDHFLPASARVFAQHWGGIALVRATSNWTVEGPELEIKVAPRPGK